MQKENESKKWQHTIAIELFNKAKVIIVSLDGIHLAIDNSQTTRRLFNKHNLRERTGRKIQEIIENEFIELPENPTATYGKLYIRKSVLEELNLLDNENWVNKGVYQGL